jgi:hypothetical protein
MDSAPGDLRFGLGRLLSICWWSCVFAHQPRNASYVKFLRSTEGLLCEQLNADIMGFKWNRDLNVVMLGLPYLASFC